MFDDLKELVKKASEVAENVPEHLQEAAFNKAFETLSSSEKIKIDGSKLSKNSKPNGNKKRRKKNNLGDEKSINKLDRTAHPEINHNNSALDNSLLLLRAVKEDLGIDGMNASDIAKVLVNKFRCSITRQAVSQALNDANRLVNRHKKGNSVIFRIMAPGEEYLETLNTNSIPDKKRTKTAKPKKAKKKKKTSNSTRKKVGPATGMSKLLDDGFFKIGRSISDIIEKLKHDRGRTFKQSELSPVLLRWLRSGKLSREKNADNQYEYKQQ